MNKFEDGLEHVKTRISRIEDNIYATTESIEKNVLDKIKLQEKILEISGIENILSELYDELYRISDFYETKNALILEGFEVELRKIYKNYYSNKISSLVGVNLLEHDKLYDLYQRSRSTLINKLKKDCGGFFLNIEAFNDVIKRLIESSEEVFGSIFNIESLYKILMCFIYTDFLMWDPFSGSEGATLPSFSAIINYVLKQCGDKFYNDGLLLRDKLVERLCSERLVNYLCEVVQQYWTPIYFKETENLVKSLSFIRDDFQIDLSQVTMCLMKRLGDSFNFLVSECLPRPDFEYKFALLVLNWGISVRLVTRTFRVKQECISATLNKSIIHFSQSVIRNHENEKVRKLFCNTQFDIEDITNNSVDTEESNSFNIVSAQLNPETFGLKHINQVVHKITNSYKLKFPIKRYILIDIIMEIISN